MDYQTNYFKQHLDSRFVMLADNVKHPFNEYLLIGVQFCIIGWILLIGMITFLLFLLQKATYERKIYFYWPYYPLLYFLFFSYPFTYHFCMDCYNNMYCHNYFWYIITLQNSIRMENMKMSEYSKTM